MSPTVTGVVGIAVLFLLFMLRMPIEVGANVIDDLRSNLGRRAGEVLKNLP